MLSEKKLCILGSGYMAEAIIKGLLQSGLIKPSNIFIVNPIDTLKVEELSSIYGIVFGDKETVLMQADIIILAFKPQDVRGALADYKNYLNKEQLLISILAGVSTGLLQELVGLAMPIVRAMPNLALGISKSATAYCLGINADADDAEMTNEIFSLLGSVTRVEEESMDAVTGLSGSGPAYICYLLEAMIKSAINEGLSEEQALGLARQTLIGTAGLLEQSEEHPEALRKKITSAKGTTEAGINKMAEKGFIKVVEEGVSAAISRSKELGKLF